MKRQISELRKRILAENPLIHCITNPISINQCANAVLAVGARPIMAEHPQEAAEITATADALLLNLGNITDARMASMGISARTAKEKGIPMVLDAVGVACSTLRREFARQLLDTAMPQVIKGNFSEIHALYRDAYRCAGVDADEQLTVAAMEQTAAALSRQLGTTILASGRVDIITDGKKLVKVGNGDPMLSSVTGTGCMLGALCAAYLTASGGLEASTAACTVLGICGQLARKDRGTGTFQVQLMDGLSCLSHDQIENLSKLEVCEIAKI